MNSSKREWPDAPSFEELECLILWPKGTIGYNNELLAIKTLHNLCKAQGFGRIPQLANCIEEIWRDPNKVEEYKKLKEEHFKLMGYGNKN